MQFTVSRPFSKEIAKVFAVYSTDDGLKRRFEGVGAKNFKVVSRKEQGESLEIVTVRDVPSDVPSVLKSFLGAYNRVKQTERWTLKADGTKRCEMVAEIEGVPVSLAGDYSLKPEGERTGYEFTMTISCSIPFVGKKLAAFLAKDAERNVVEEHACIETLI